MDSNPPGKLEDSARRTKLETEFGPRGKRTDDALIELLPPLVGEEELGPDPTPAPIPEVLDPPPDRFALLPLAWPDPLPDGVEVELPPLLLAAVPA